MQKVVGRARQHRRAELHERSSNGTDMERRDPSGCNMAWIVQTRRIKSAWCTKSRMEVYIGN